MVVVLVVFLGVEIDILRGFSSKYGVGSADAEAMADAVGDGEGFSLCMKLVVALKV